MLIELLRRTAASSPGQPLVITPARTARAAELLREANALAAGLHQRRIARFGSLARDLPDVIALICAASAAGSEICLYPPDLDEGQALEIAKRFGHEVLVAGEPPAPEGITVLTVADLANSDGEEPPPPESSPVLILTTGTTGARKGARHDWSRLVAAIRRPDERTGTRWYLAYNPNQFAGIQLLIHVLASGGTLVSGASNRPGDAIRAMREHDVTHASGTPTFWRLLAGSLDAEGARELSLRQITLGGEAAPESLIERLRALFPDARITHVYAGTEFGSVVSVPDGRGGLPASLLERDESSPVQMRIVDGELQVRSEAGMLGYHEGADESGAWHSTGDLVEVRGDRIHFVGRATAVINVGGAKVHPLPIEEVVGEVPGVELAHAYGRSNPVTGQIVAIDVVAAEDASHEELEAAIRAACDALPPASRPRRIRFVDEVQITGSKLVRSSQGEP